MRTLNIKVDPALTKVNFQSYIDVALEWWSLLTEVDKFTFVAEILSSFDYQNVTNQEIVTIWKSI